MADSPQKRPSLMKRLSRASFGTKPTSHSMVINRKAGVVVEVSRAVEKWSRQQLVYWLKSAGLKCLLPLLDVEEDLSPNPEVVSFSTPETSFFIHHPHINNFLKLAWIPVNKIPAFIGIPADGDLRKLFDYDDFIKDFIVVQSVMISPKDLLNALQERFHKQPSLLPIEYDEPQDEEIPMTARGSPDPSKNKEAISMIAYLKEWVNFDGHYEMANDPAFLRMFQVFCDIHIAPVNAIDAKLLKTEVKAKIKQKKKDKKFYTEEAPTPIKPSKNKDFALSDIHPKELARQMTLLEEKIFIQIRAKEFLKQAWNKGNHEVNAPFITLLTRNFNKMINWITTEVLKVPETSARAEVITKFIKVAKHFEKLKNFNGVMQVLSSLHSSAISRLKQSWALITPKSKNHFDRLTAIMSNLSNFKVFRETYSALEEDEPCIPFIAVFLTDCTYLDDTMNDKDQEGRWNWEKLSTMAAKIREIRRFGMRRYDLIPVSSIQAYIESAESWNDNKTLYAISQLTEGTGSEAGGLGTAASAVGGTLKKSDVRKAYSKFNRVTVANMNLRSMYLKTDTTGDQNTLSQRDWKILLTGATLKTYNEGDIILDIGVANTILYRIKTGMVKVHKSLSAPPVATMGKDEMFGEISMLLRGEDGTTTAAIVAACPVEIWEIAIDFVLQMCEGDHLLSEKLHRIIAVKLASRLRALNTTRAKSRASRSPRNKIIKSAETKNDEMVLSSSTDLATSTVIEHSSSAQSSPSTGKKSRRQSAEIHSSDTTPPVSQNSSLADLSSVLDSHRSPKRRSHSPQNSEEFLKGEASKSVPDFSKLRMLSNRSPSPKVTRPRPAEDSEQVQTNTLPVVAEEPESSPRIVLSDCSNQTEATSSESKEKPSQVPDIRSTTPSKLTDGSRSIPPKSPESTKKSKRHSAGSPSASSKSAEAPEARRAVSPAKSLSAFKGRVSSAALPRRTMSDGAKEPAVIRFERPVLSQSDDKFDRSADKHTDKPEKNDKKEKDKEKEKADIDPKDIAFRKKFHLKENVILIRQFDCAMKGTVLAHGNLYISEKYWCFGASVFGMKTREVIQVQSITSIEIVKKYIVIRYGSSKSLKLLGFENLEDTLSFLTNFWEKFSRASATASASSFSVPVINKRNRINRSSLSIDSPSSVKEQETEEDELEDESSKKNSKFEMTEQDWANILKGANLVAFQKGDFVIKEGDQFQRVFQLLRGSACIQKEINGVATTLGRLTPEDGIFGEISFLEGGCATASIVADEPDTAVYIIEGYFLNVYFERNPGMSGRFYHFLAHLLSKRLKQREADAAKAAAATRLVSLPPLARLEDIENSGTSEQSPIISVHPGTPSSSPSETKTILSKSDDQSGPISPIMSPSQLTQSDGLQVRTSVPHISIPEEPSLLESSANQNNRSFSSLPSLDRELSASQSTLPAIEETRDEHSPRTPTSPRSPTRSPSRSPRSPKSPRSPRSDELEEVPLPGKTLLMSGSPRTSSPSSTYVHVHVSKKKKRSKSEGPLQHSIVQSPSSSNSSIQ